MVHVGVAEKNARYVKGRILADVEISGDQICPIDVELGQKAEVNKVVNAPSITIP